MSVTSITERTDSPQGQAHADGSRTYRRMFDVTTNDANDGPYVVLSNGSLPQPGDIYVAGNDIDVTARAKSADAKRNPERATLWMATYEYDTKTEEQQQNDPNPFNRPPQVRIDVEKKEIVATKDKNRKSLLNSARVPYEGVTRLISYPTLQITRNEAPGSFSMANDLNYLDRINSDTFFGVAAGRVKCDTINATRAFENDTEYYERTYVFTVDPTSSPWTLELLNAGLTALTSANSTTPAGRIPEGRAGFAAEPQLLKSDGTVEPSTSNAIYNTFELYRTAAFGSLNLPNGI